MGLAAPIVASGMARLVACKPVVGSRSQRDRDRYSENTKHTPPVVARTLAHHRPSQDDLVLIRRLHASSSMSRNTNPHPPREQLRRHP